MPEATVTIANVDARKTQSGNTRFVIRDEAGREYTTFREAIAKDALAAEGRKADITYHEQQRGQFTNVYLDSVKPHPEQPEAQGTPDATVEEVAWKTAVDAAPWLLGREPDEAVPPDELFERLEPFKQRVADDIRPPDEDDS
ncbi:MAG TPA: hypothetical protein VI408_08830 [Gaiellaceae bacterium]